jgi:hypothetical protein
LFISKDGSYDNIATAIGCPHLRRRYVHFNPTNLAKPTHHAKPPGMQERTSRPSSTPRTHPLSPIPPSSSSSQTEKTHAASYALRMHPRQSLPPTSASLHSSNQTQVKHAMTTISKLRVLSYAPNRMRLCARGGCTSSARGS